MDVEGGGGEEPDGKRKKYRLQNKPPVSTPSVASSSLDSGLGSFEESEGKADEPSMGKEDAEHSFRFTYLGSALVDRRYTQSMLPWVILEVKRRKERVEIDLNVEFMTVKALDLAGGLVFQHRVQTITRFARSRDTKCFAYITKGFEENCYCYAFEMHDSTSLPGFVACIKQAAKQQTGDTTPNAKSEDVSSNHDVPQSPAVKHTLWYVGKVVVSHRQAPPTLIDDFVRRFKNLRKSVGSERDPKVQQATGRKSAQASPTATPKKGHVPAFKTQSLESGMLSSGMGRVKESLEPPREPATATSRPRSASDGDQRKMHHVLKDDGHHNLVIARSHTRAASFGNETENRNVVFHITDHSVTIIGLVSKVVWMEKRLKEISFCQQGSENSDHFGFICHEAKTSQFVCYIFKGQSEQLVDSVMRSLKQAFHIAWQATGPTTVCEMCPLHHLHQLCVQLEGFTTVQQHNALQKHLTNLSDEEMNDFTDKYQVEGPLENAEEENEVVMAILRGLYEKRQQKHTHTTQAQPAKDAKPGPGLLQKAKKSFDMFIRGRSKTTVRADEEAGCGEDTPGQRRARSLTEGYLSPNSATPPMSPIEEKPPKNLEVVSPLASGRMGKLAPVGTGNRSLDSSPGASPPRSPVKPTGGRPRRSSYRQVIFHSIVAPPKKSSVSSYDGDGTSDTDMEKSPRCKRTPEEVQGLWRKAIMEQILLNRMEKENKSLKVYQDVSELRRLKLSYDELCACPKATSELWDKILSSQEATMDLETLVDAVRAGVSKARRGEVWKFLIHQHQLWAAASDGSPAWQAASYRELKDGLSNQQHSIFIDLGRTFPSHRYFAEQLGHGQICLFNLLKAYSVLDKAVGYCQGLSFVAGLLLMHLDEEEAFEALRHLMYAFSVRKQYKADMQELQMRFYKLSRLLHDHLEPVYDCLEEQNVSPTLYAAPWFLTIFASHFQIGFVVRVMDLIFLEGFDVVFKIVLVLLTKSQKEILAADGFEGVVECMKTFLPTFAVQNMELIVAEALKMDVSKDLEAYEVEYRIFQEEGMSIASFEELESQRIASLEAENVVLSRQVHDLSENLSCYRNTVENLEGSITTLQMNQAQLQNIIRSLREENNALREKLERYKSKSDAKAQNQNQVAQDGAELVPATAETRSGSRELNTSFTEENTDSYEHIDENDVTDDEAESISRDSPANGLSEAGSGGGLSLTRKTDDLTVSR